MSMLDVGLLDVFAHCHFQNQHHLALVCVCGALHCVQHASFHKLIVAQISVVHIQVLHQDGYLLLYQDFCHS
jgi:hypothetical protein